MDQREELMNTIKEVVKPPASMAVITATTENCIKIAEVLGIEKEFKEKLKEYPSIPVKTRLVETIVDGYKIKFICYDDPRMDSDSATILPA